MKEVVYKANVHLLHVLKNTQDDTVRYEWYEWAHSTREISCSEFKCLEKHKNVLTFYSTILMDGTAWTCMLAPPSVELLGVMKKEWNMISEMHE